MGYGFNIPLTPRNNIIISDYAVPRHLDLGIRYMIDEYLGLKVHYARDRFQDINDKNVGNSYHRLSIEAVFNITGGLKLYSNDFNMIFHGGVGITHAYPESIRRFENGGEFTFGLTPYGTKPYERIGNIILGLTPKYRFSDKMAFSFDVAYIINTQQQYDYSGELMYISRRKVRGSFLNFSVGVQYYLGKKRRHADWHNGGRKN